MNSPPVDGTGRCAIVASGALDTAAETTAADLKASLSAAERRATTAEKRADAAETATSDLASRAAELDERETQLDTRATELDDREAVIGAAEEAVAASQIGIGTWTVGVDVEPGTYRTTEPVASSCYWGIYRTGTNQDDIIQNDIVNGGHPTVTLSAGQDFESDCGTWSKQ
ncbi:hypothetical protein [Cellulomonas sp. PSBB021]|uniref:hypothetical protein n=1 Tax=Cellulomonas sp. PSBB021 TaxID=2003551 RepID=UPI0018DF0D3B|nr:hypothetical protein [Cellulomonas sp. PSBB021]